MSDVLREQLSRFVVTEMPSRLGEGWQAKRLKRSPFAVIWLDRSGLTYFVAFYWQPRSVRFWVELGWKEAGKKGFPTAEVNQTEPENADVHGTEFAIRLFWLCVDRGRSEQLWDLFSTEVWDGEKESFIEFRKKRVFDSADEELRILESGGPTEAYAIEKAKLLGSDVLSCLSRYGLPFLQRVIDARA